MKILKFGGTSVGSPLRMHSVSTIINDSEPKIVVLSAMSGTTNSLVEICNLIKQKEINSAKTKWQSLFDTYLSLCQSLFNKTDYQSEAKNIIEGIFILIDGCISNRFSLKEEKIILAQGELLSSNLFHMLLKEKNISNVLIPALDFMLVNEDGEPLLDEISTKLTSLIHTYPSTSLFITQGYICRNTNNEIDNLQRGGSDYSASLIGAAVNASEIQIWTDIDGMHNNDPRIVEKTFPISELSFDEAAELAYFGAKILHPSSVLPAKLKNIPVKLLNTLQPEAKGTVIQATSNGNDIKAVAAKDHIIAVKIKSGRMLMAYGFLKAVFEVFEKYKTPIDMITTSEVAISLTIDKQEHLEKIKKELLNFGSVEIDYDQTIICIVGDFLADRPGYAYKVLQTLKDIPIRMISYGGSKNNISILINTEFKTKALNSLNEGLFFTKNMVSQN